MIIIIIIIISSSSSSSSSIIINIISIIIQSRTEGGKKFACSQGEPVSYYIALHMVSFNIIISSIIIIITIIIIIIINIEIINTIIINACLALLVWHMSSSQVMNDVANQLSRIRQVINAIDKWGRIRQATLDKQCHPMQSSRAPRRRTKNHRQRKGKRA